VGNRKRSHTHFLLGTGRTQKKKKKLKVMNHWVHFLTDQKQTLYFPEWGYSTPKSKQIKTFFIQRSPFWRCTCSTQTCRWTVGRHQQRSSATGSCCFGEHHTLPKGLHCEQQHNNIHLKKHHVQLVYYSRMKAILNTHTK
jgi:hypothetical protein